MNASYAGRLRAAMNAASRFARSSLSVVVLYACSRDWSWSGVKPRSAAAFRMSGSFSPLMLWGARAVSAPSANARNAAILPKNPAGKEVAQPKGWLVNFTTRSVLVDFDGGKVTTKSSTSSRGVTEDAATELLIVRPDGKLLVKRSDTDDKDDFRQKTVSGWESWIDTVRKRVFTEAGGGMDNEFKRP